MGRGAEEEKGIIALRAGQRPVSAEAQWFSRFRRRKGRAGPKNAMAREKRLVNRGKYAYNSIMC